MIDPGDLLPAGLLLAALGLVRLLLVAPALRLRRRLRDDPRLRRRLAAWRVRPPARQDAAGSWRARLAGWARARLAPDGFTGLPLTLLVLALAGMAALLVEIAAELVEREDLAAFDHAVLGLLAPLRTPPLLDAFAWITQLGSNAALGAVLLLATAVFWVLRRPALNLGLWVTVAGSQAMLWAGKWGFGRARPEALVEHVPSSASFPSGHATGAMAVYGFLAYGLARLAASERQRIEVVFWAAVLIVLVGFSRVYLQVHYPSDVAAGFLTGGLWLLVGVAVSEWRGGRR